MKRVLAVLIVALTAGCAGMGGMHSSGNSSGASADSYRPNVGPAYQRMDSSFHPYFGG